LVGDFIGIILAVEMALRRHHREPRTGREPDGAKEFADIPSAFLIYRRHCASSHVTTIALLQASSQQNPTVHGWHVRISTRVSENIGLSIFTPRFGICAATFGKRVP
jgi:hypothetical protein